MTADADKAKSRLAAKRAELAALSAIAAAARRPGALDQQTVGRLSRMAALQRRIMAGRCVGRR